MRVRRPGAGARGFTLLELLIVVCIIGILVTMVITSLSSARRRAQVAVAKSNIQAMKAALSMYESDTGKFPKRLWPTPPNGPSAALFRNDIAYAYAALRNRAVTIGGHALGGGPNTPYLEWKPEQIGYPNGTGSAWDDPSYGANPGPTVPVVPGTWANAIPAGDQSYLLPTGSAQGDGGQSAHTADGNLPYIFLDPWGNPYEYIEWASVPTQYKDTLAQTPSIKVTSYPTGSGGTGSGASEDHFLAPHDPSKFDIWSWGPNGVNEGGEGDDVNSWSDVKK